jgi:hypothetical protein
MSLSHWPERMPESCYDSEIDDSCIAFLEEARRSPSRSVAYLNGARLGRSLECGRREGEIAYCFERTPARANVPEARPFCCSKVRKRSQHGILEGNVVAGPHVERVSWRGIDA